MGYVIPGGAVVVGDDGLIVIRAGTPSTETLVFARPALQFPSGITLNTIPQWSIRRRGKSTNAASQYGLGGWGFSVDNAQTPTTATITPPVGVENDNYHLSYSVAGKGDWSLDFRVIANDAPTGAVVPVAPIISNITGESVDYAAPATLAASFEYYLPQIYDPVLTLWQTAGPNLYGGDSGTAAKLRTNTGGYKMRFVGVPPADSGGISVNGIQTATFSTLFESPPIACAAHPDGKDISAAYKAHLQSSVTSRALLFRVVRRDGVVFGYTTHDVDIDGDNIKRSGVTVPECAGVLFVARAGMTPTGIQHKTGTEADNMDVQVIFEDDRISVEDLRSGAYDDAQVFIMECNWADLSMGVMKHKRGWIGRISWDSQKFDASLRGLSDKLGARIIEETSITCRAAQLGDERCRFNVNGNIQSGLSAKATPTITSVDTSKKRKRFQCTALAAYADGDFAYGRMRITQAGSPNLNVWRKVRRSEGGWIELAENMPHDLVTGDSLEIIVGCDRRGETCFAKFSNMVNFVGENWLPGPTVYDKG